MTDQKEEGPEGGEGGEEGGARKATVGDYVTRLARHASNQSVALNKAGRLVVHGNVDLLKENPAEPCKVCHHTAQK